MMQATRSKGGWVGLVVGLVVWGWAAAAVAQAGAAQAGAVPRAIPVSGVVLDDAGQPVSGVRVVRFAIYADETGSDPLWIEEQTLRLDERGRYGAWLGLTGAELPLEVFQTGEARWLAVEVADLPPLPRTRLLSVPYALKASDAETLGGLPPSAFLLADGGGGVGLQTRSGTTPLALPREAGTSAAAGNDAPLLPSGVEEGGSPYRTAYGSGALAANTTGLYNAAFGWGAMASNTTGGYNTAVGLGAMNGNVSGNYNVAVGTRALDSVTTTHNNTAVGVWAQENATGSDNTAVGKEALKAVTGSDNAALGLQALMGNTSGSGNTAVGAAALRANTTGTGHTAVGFEALLAATAVYDNTAVGYRALTSATTGHNNTALGESALLNLTTGTQNVGVGEDSLLGLATGSWNVALGSNAGTNATGSHNVYIANDGLAGESNVIYLGTTGTHTKTVLAGNVGVGTGTPAHRLDVAGNVNTSGTFLFGAGVYGLRHYGGIVMFDGGSGYPDGYRLATRSQPGGAVELLDNGYLGIGITTPVQPLHVAGNIRTDATFLFGSGYGLRATGGVVRFDGGTNYPEGYSFSTSGLPSGAVTITAAGLMGLNVLAPSHPLEHSSGAHLTAGGVWTNASSRALKDRIAPLTAEAAADAVLALQPVTYVYKADPGDPQVGFIAEDVPALVATNDRTSLAPMDIVAVLTKVIQGQQAELSELRAQVADLQVLRERLAALEQVLGRQR